MVVSPPESMCPGMSLASTLTLTDSASASKSFVTIATPSGMIGTIRIDNSTTLTAPRLSRISHTTSKESGTVVDRHLAQISHQKLNSAGVPAKPLSASFTLVVPRDSTYTNTDVDDAIALLLSELALSGFKTSFKLGES